VSSGETTKIMASAALAGEVASAVAKALEAGLSKEHVAAVLGRVVELLEEDE
jgi:predicted fused transcriptional regulator/phosphomethylpyrimidine kinase